MRRVAALARTAALTVLCSLGGVAIAGHAAEPDSADGSAGMDWALQPLLSWTAEQGVGAGVRLYALGPPPASSRIESQVFVAQHAYWSLQLTYRTYRLRGSRYSLRTRRLFEDDGSSRFFGIGNGSSLDDEIRYRRGRFVIALEPGRRLGRAWEVRARLHLADDEVELEQSPLSIGGRSYASSTAARALVSAVVQHDRRDIEWAPTGGTLSLLELGRSLGPDLDYWRLRADLRAYRQLVPGLVIAGRAELDAVEGADLPFYVMPTYGGSRFGRGFVSGRFRDAARRSLAAELRWQALRRVGLVGFVDAGEVAPGLLDAAPGGVHIGFGCGLRVQPGPRGLISRLDFGYGGAVEGLHIYLNFGHAL